MGKKPRGKPFCVGFDPRRHSLSKFERSKGYHNAPSRIKCAIRCLYRLGKLGRQRRSA